MTSQVGISPAEATAVFKARAAAAIVANVFMMTSVGFVEYLYFKRTLLQPIAGTVTEPVSGSLQLWSLKA